MKRPDRNDRADENWNRLEQRILTLIAEELAGLARELVRIRNGVQNLTTEIHQQHEGQRNIMANLQDLNDAITQLSVDLGEAVTRIEAKIAEGNPDLQPEVDAIRAASAQLDSLAADPVTAPPVNES